eukprot:1153833-Pelagomonas_calceolata.AAC.2
MVRMVEHAGAARQVPLARCFKRGSHGRARWCRLADISKMFSIAAMRFDEAVQMFEKGRPT